MGKTFKTPAMDFFSPETIEAVDGKPETKEKPEAPKKTGGKQAKKTKASPAPKGAEKPPAGYKRNPEFIEMRSKRFQLLTQPSVYDAVKARAEADGVSMGEVINRAIAEYLSK